MLCVAPTVIYILPMVSGFQEQYMCIRFCFIVGKTPTELYDMFWCMSMNKMEENVAWINELIHENRCGTIPDLAHYGESHTMPKHSDTMKMQINCLKINFSFIDKQEQKFVSLCQKLQERLRTATIIFFNDLRCSNLSWC